MNGLQVSRVTNGKLLSISSNCRWRHFVYSNLPFCGSTKLETRSSWRHRSHVTTEGGPIMMLMNDDSRRLGAITRAPLVCVAASQKYFRLPSPQGSYLLEKSLSHGFFLNYLISIEVLHCLASQQYVCYTHLLTNVNVIKRINICSENLSTKETDLSRRPSLSEHLLCVLSVE
jgi:hypothetical protein